MTLSAPPARRVVIAVTVLAIVLGVVSVVRATRGSSDFRGFHTLWARNLAAPYLPERRQGAVEEDPDPYPPITYLIFAPLGALPLPLAATVWAVLNTACLYDVWRQTRDRLCGGAVTRPLIIATLAVAPFAAVGLLLGQNTPLLLWLTWTAYGIVERNLLRSTTLANGTSSVLLAGGMLMLAALIKVIPVVFLVPMLLRGRWLVVAGAALTAGLLLGVGGSLYFGPAQNVAFHQRWLDVSLHGTEGLPQDPLNPNTMRGSTRLNNQSLEAVLARLTMPLPADRKKHPFTVNVVTWNAETWRRSRDWLTAVITLGFLAALIRSRGGEQAAASSPATRHAPPATRPYALMAVLALSISPIVWSHYYVWLFVPLTWLGTHGGRGGRAVVWIWIAAELAAILPWSRAAGLNYMATLLVGVALATLEPRGNGPQH